MPNLVLDYPAGLEARLDIDGLLDALHASALASGLFKLTAIKLYARPYAYGRAAGEKTEFVHLSVHMFEGRGAEQKAALSEALLATLDERCPSGLAAAVEICAIEKDSYRKRDV